MKISKKTKSIKENDSLSQPCCIYGCDRFGTRLLSSLRASYPLKENHSGRVCEGHYRRDLRRFKKSPQSKPKAIEKIQQMSEMVQTKKTKTNKKSPITNGLKNSMNNTSNTTIPPNHKNINGYHFPFNPYVSSALYQNSQTHPSLNNHLYNNNNPLLKDKELPLRSMKLPVLNPNHISNNKFAYPYPLYTYNSELPPLYNNVSPPPKQPMSYSYNSYREQESISASPSPQHEPNYNIPHADYSLNYSTSDGYNRAVDSPISDRTESVSDYSPLPPLYTDMQYQQTLPRKEITFEKEEPTESKKFKTFCEAVLVFEGVI